MIGVQAIFGGLAGLLLLSTVALLAIAGLLIGCVLIIQKRPAAGTAISVTSALTISFIVHIALQAAPVTIDHLTLDFSDKAEKIRANLDEGCATEQEWCQTKGRIRALTIVMPDGTERRFSANSVLVQFYRHMVQEVVIHLGQPSSQLLSLIEAEQATGVTRDPQSVDKFKQALSTDAVVRSDQLALFSHKNYSITVTALPRNGAKEEHRVIYGLHFSQATQ